MLSHLQPFWDPMDCILPGSSVLGIFQARTLEWVAFPSPVHESEKWKWSPTLRPHGLQPTRLLCPWDFPGKSTGVGHHCLLWTHIELGIFYNSTMCTILGHYLWNYFSGKMNSVVCCRAVRNTPRLLHSRRPTQILTMSCKQFAQMTGQVLLRGRHVDTVGRERESNISPLPKSLSHPCPILCK